MINGTFFVKSTRETEADFSILTNFQPILVTTRFMPHCAIQTETNR